MTVEEMGRAVARAYQERVQLLEEMARYARGLVATLKDRGCMEAARGLEEKLFMLDASSEATTKLVTENFGTFLELLRPRP